MADGSASEMGENDNAILTITVRDQEGGRMEFKIKRSTKMSKVFEAYAQKRAVAVGDLQFQYNGARVSTNQTPAEAGMEDGDCLDAFRCRDVDRSENEMDQNGPKPEKGEQDNAIITIKIKDQEGGDIQFKIKRSTKMGKVFGVYAKKRDVDPKSVRFLFEGTRVTEDQTPADVGLENEDCLDAMVTQLGGGARRW